MGSGLIWAWVKTCLCGVGVLTIVVGVWTFVIVHASGDPIWLAIGGVFSTVMVIVGMILVGLGVAA